MNVQFVGAEEVAEYNQSGYAVAARDWHNVRAKCLFAMGQPAIYALTFYIALHPVVINLR